MSNVKNKINAVNNGSTKAKKLTDTMTINKQEIELQKLIDTITQQQLQQNVTITTTGTSGISGLTFNGLHGIIQPQDLTIEEEKELNELEDLHKFDSKRLKLNYFKSLPKEFRQQMVNVLLWDDLTKEINEISADKPSRLIELRVKKDGNSPYYIRNHIINGNSWWLSGHIKISESILPEGITKEELLQAHLDASLEEEISESK